MEKRCGDEVGRFEDLEVALGGVVAFGAVNDGLATLVPCDLLQREGVAQQILGEALAARMVSSRHEIIASIVYLEARMLPTQQVGEFALTDELVLAQEVQKAMPKDFVERANVAFRQPVKAAVGRKEAVADEHMQVRMEDEVVAKGVDGGHGSNPALRQVKLDAKYVSDGFNGALKEEADQAPALAKDAAQHLGHGEDELTMGHGVADGARNPLACAPYTPLMTSRAEVALLAGEGQKTLVTTIRTFQAGEAGGQVPTSHEGLDSGLGSWVERPQELAVPGFVMGEKIAPTVMHHLPQG